MRIGQGPPLNVDLLREPVIRPGKERNLLHDIGRLWPDGVVYYKVDESAFNASELANIATGIADVETKMAGCMTFNDLGDTSPDLDYIFISQFDTGCYYEGGGYQPGVGQLRINLETPGCDVSLEYILCAV